MQILGCEQFSLQSRWYFLPLCTDPISNEPTENSLFVEVGTVDMKQQKDVAAWGVGRERCVEMFRRAQDGWDQHDFLNTVEPDGELCSLVHPGRLEGMETGYQNCFSCQILVQLKNNRISV